MLTSEYVLELTSVFHSGQVEVGTCLQKTIGTVRTGVILKDVSMEVHGGELAAVLGSKGSGKRALLEVMSRRAQGPTRGQILLNGVPMSLRLFQESCGYVTQRFDLIPGLSVRQTLDSAAAMTLGSKVSGYVRSARVKQVMADLALSPLSNRRVDALTPGEAKRVAIGMQLVRDPVVLLLDEPTQDLDPLNTYFIVSILANYAKKYNRIVIVTMEKPRSDIFPFLDRVTYLCLGDVVYTGATRMMLDYFRAIGFPCPELENPLMYYLCLSTVDRRSRERFIESNNQIASLVEKFKLEGGAYRKFSAATTALDAEHSEMHQRVPLSAYGKASSVAVFFALIRRSWALLSPFNRVGLKQFLLRLILTPAFFFLLWIFYFEAFRHGMDEKSQLQTTYVTRNGLIFNCLAGAYFMSIIVTGCSFPVMRTRYYQESREGIYSGPLFIVANFIQSLPITLISMLISSLIIFRGLQNELVCSVSSSGESSCRAHGDAAPASDADSDSTSEQWLEYAYFPDLVAFWIALWACHAFAEQHTISALMVIKSSFTAITASVALAVLYLVLGSATMRSYSSLPEFLYHLTYVTQSRYAGAVLNGLEFHNRTSLVGLQWQDETGRKLPCHANAFGFGCRYVNGSHYLEERYGLTGGDMSTFLDVWFNVGIALVFPFAMLAINVVAYLIPLPAFVKAKFRE